MSVWHVISICYSGIFALSHPQKSTRIHKNRWQPFGRSELSMTAFPKVGQRYPRPGKLSGIPSRLQAYFL